MQRVAIFNYDLSTLVHGRTSVSLASHTLYVVIGHSLRQEPVRSHAVASYPGRVGGETAWVRGYTCSCTSRWLGLIVVFTAI